MRKILVVLCFPLFVATVLKAQPSVKKIQESFRSSRSNPESQPELNISEKMADQASIRFRGNSGLKTAQAVAWLKTQSGFRQGKDELVADLAGEITVNSMRIEKYQQYFQNIKVEHGRVNISSGNDLVNAMQLEIYPVPENLKLIPSITQSDALSKAVDFVGAKKYPWDNYQGREPSLLKPSGTLVIVQDIFRKVGTLCLAWKFKISADEPLSRSWVYVNAENGTVVFSDAIIKHAAGPAHAATKTTAAPVAKKSPLVNAAGSAQTRYSGSQTLITDMRDTSYHLRELRNSDSIVTLNYQRRAVTASNSLLARDFNDFDNNWSAAEHDNAAWDNVALDVHFGIEKVSDYWNNVHGRAGWDNAHGKFLSYVHVRATANANYDNAFWDGQAMNYGDGTFLSGTASGFLPLTSLDVTAHELGHGVCEVTAGLVYQRESGGLNEAFSDIWGACVEHYANLGGNKRDFLIGEEIYPSRGFLRSMSNPNQANNPDTYGGLYWAPVTIDGCPLAGNSGTSNNDYCGVHGNSGVLNKWFYLITQGEAGTNDFGNRYTVNGLGFSKSEKIAYLTELLLTPNSDFAAARQASITAATSLYGACSNEVIQVINGWFAVGVGACSECSPLVEFNVGSVSISENGETNDGCSFKTYNIPVKLPVASDQPITLTFAWAGTAIPNIDYSVPGNTLVIPAGESGIKNFPVTILDDGSNDGNKTLQFSYSFDGAGGNGGQSPNNQVFTLTILDNDVAPSRIIATPIFVSTLVNENFETSLLTFPVGWREAVFANNLSINKWIIAANGGPGISGQAAYISSDTINKSLTYNDTSATRRALITRVVNTKNLVNLKLSFKCKANGELDINGPDGSNLYDYGFLYYSLNGTTLIQMPNPATGNVYKFYGRGADAFDVGPLMLPAALNNQSTLYIGFGWMNDALVSGGTPFLIDDVVITGTTGGAAVKTAANQTGSTAVLSGSYDSYIYSKVDSQLIARISGVNQNLGCVTASITSSGNGKRVIQGMENYRATQKVYQISPATENTTAGNTVYLYFTSDELAVWGTNRNKLRMMKIRSGVDLNGPISSADVQIVTPTTIIDNTDSIGSIIYGGNFTGFSQYVLVEPLVALPVTMRDIKVTTRSQDAKLDWETEAEINNKGYEILRSFDGVEYEKIGFVDGKGNLAGISRYEFIDSKIPANVMIYYRIRQVDLDQRSMLSRVVSARLGNAAPTFVTIWPNPAKELLNISFANRVTKGRVSIMSPEGQLMQEQIISNPVTNLRVKLGKMPAGVYLVKYSDGIRTETRKFLKR